MLIIIIAAFGPLAFGYYQIRDMLPQQKEYDQAVQTMSPEDGKALLEQAYAYNRSLYNVQRGEGEADRALLARYEDLLCVGDTSIMGRIKIPAISVDLVIYHGAGQKALQSGVGHWHVSSLPVGGKNTRAVLEGHRGLSSAELFTRLDEMRKGDIFFIQVLNKTMAYEVDDIRVILPEQTDQLKIREGRDEVTLVTCTPYNINTHRLLVTGHRIPYKKGMEDNIHRKIPSLRELVFMGVRVLIVVLILFILIRSVRDRRKSRKSTARTDRSGSKVRG